MPCEGNWVDGKSHPSNRDVEPECPFQSLSRLPVDCSSEGTDSLTLGLINEHGDLNSMYEVIFQMENEEEQEFFS